MKSKRRVYPVVTVTYMLDDGCGAINEVAGLSGSVDGLTVDFTAGRDMLSTAEFSHVLKNAGRLADEATSTLYVLETEIVRDEF